MMGISQKHLIYGALTFFSLLGAILKVTVLDAPKLTFTVVYLGILYVVFVAWAISQLRTIHAREQEELVTPGPADIRLENPPSEDTLVSAETYLSLGESLDTVCRFVEPRYADWNPAEKQAFRQGLRAAVEERRLRG